MFCKLCGFTTDDVEAIVEHFRIKHPEQYWEVIQEIIEEEGEGNN